MLMRKLFVPLLTMVVSLAASRPAAADITVITHYTFVNGDTLTRASYYSKNRIRVTGPDGTEYLFDQKTDSVTVIHHAAKTYWTGPRAAADSIAKKIMAANREGIPEEATADPVAWSEKIQAFNDSIQVETTNRKREIAGYPCDLWVLTAGSYLRNERWIARSLAVRDYGPEMQKVVMASIPDPLGRALMRLMIAMRTKEGLVLSGSATFRTFSQSGSFAFEALRVSDKSIPKSAWSVPEGYAPASI